MRLDIIAGLIQTAGLGVMGQNIFIHRMGAEVVEGILLKLPIDGITTDFDLPGYYKTTFQVIVRARLQADGDTLAKALTELLTIYSTDYNDPTSGNFALQIKQMFPAKLPIVYPRSDGQGIEWSLNLYACYVQA